MDEALRFKENAPALLDRQLFLRARKQEYGVIVLASATDPYLHFEQDLKLTRQLLEIILKHRFPVHIITRSQLVTRDFDLLERIADTAILPKDLQPVPEQKSFITFSFSTLDDTIGARFEPGAPLPSARLRTLEDTLRAGFLSGVSLMPLLPYISDTAASIEHIYSTFSEVGARYLFPAGLTLYGSAKSDSLPLMLRAISRHYPELLPQYERLFLHDSSFARYYREKLSQKLTETGMRYKLPSHIPGVKL